MYYFTRARKRDFQNALFSHAAKYDVYQPERISAARIYCHDDLPENAAIIPTARRVSQFFCLSENSCDYSNTYTRVLRRGDRFSRDFFTRFYLFFCSFVFIVSTHRTVRVILIDCVHTPQRDFRKKLVICRDRIV